MEDIGFLKFTDDNLKTSFLQNLGTMRKHRLFCDVILNVSVIFLLKNLSINKISDLTSSPFEFLKSTKSKSKVF